MLIAVWLLNNTGEVRKALSSLVRVRTTVGIHKSVQRTDLKQSLLQTETNLVGQLPNVMALAIYHLPIRGSCNRYHNATGLGN